jgi:hypothetical protein
MLLTAVLWGKNQYVVHQHVPAVASSRRGKHHPQIQWPELFVPMLLHMDICFVVFFFTF